MGSSPPVRGAHTVCPIPRRPAGLIPARAGSTAAICSSVTCSGAHPRPCGEHVDASPASSKEPGSSPPVRGALDSRSAWPGRAGLIPARAGSTSKVHLLINKMGAHPRPCGEHAHSGAADLFRSGSSPPVRGAQFLNPLARILGGSSPPVRGAQENGLEPCHQSGLIPARAGSTHLLCRYR